MDHDDILKFRKTCAALFKKGYTRKQAGSELGLSEPSLFKLLNVPMSDLKGLRASTLGALQDFNKEHKDDLEYSDIPGQPPEEVAEPRTDAETYLKQQRKEADKLAEERTNAETYLKQQRKEADKLAEERTKEVREEEKEPRRRTAKESHLQDTFWNLINEAARCVPANIQVIIRIKSKNL